MAKKIQGYIKMLVLVGKANPSPPIGPALGQRGLNIMEFCKAFNAKTQNHAYPDARLPVVITYYSDKSFTFEYKNPEVTYFIKKFSKVAKGSKETGKVIAGSITAADIKEIAKIKMVDMNANTIEAACNMVAGTARSMGIRVIEG